MKYFIGKVHEDLRREEHYKIIGESFLQIKSETNEEKTYNHAPR